MLGMESAGVKTSVKLKAMSFGALHRECRHDDVRQPQLL
jgi:hypothetical protein